MLQRRLPGTSFISLWCVFCILIVTLGCGRISELTNKNSESEDGPTLGSSPSASEDDVTPSGADSLVKKSNLYITECYNKYSNRVVDSHNRYAMWVKDIDAGPTGRETLVYGLYDVNGDGNDCEKAVAQAKEMEPDLPDLEAASDAYVTALKDVIRNIREVYSYYEQEDYKDDKFAKGRSAHPALVASFKAFKTANDAFAAGVDKLEDQVAEAELAKLGDDPSKRYEYLIVESGIKAKKIKTLLQNKEFAQISADELSPLIDDFAATVETMRNTETKAMMSDSYVRSCDDFTKASKELMRRIRDGKKFNDSERRFIASGAGWMVEGSPQKVIKAYNDMIMQRRFTRF